MMHYLSYHTNYYPYFLYNSLLKSYSIHPYNLFLSIMIYQIALLILIFVHITIKYFYFYKYYYILILILMLSKTCLFLLHFFAKCTPESKLLFIDSLIAFSWFFLNLEIIYNHIIIYELSLYYFNFFIFRMLFSY